MGKKGKSKKHQSFKENEKSHFDKSETMDAAQLPSTLSSSSLVVSNDNSTGTISLKNPLWKIQRDFLNGLSDNERNNYFDSDAITPERRAELWMAQAELDTVNRFAWATPDERAMNILRHFAPIVEMGCGANAYWCRQMIQNGIDVIGYDVAPDTGGTIQSQQSLKSRNVGEQNGTHNKSQSDFAVRHGGPEILRKHIDRTLFLCYPDEDDGTVLDGDGQPVPLAAACLEHYAGDYVIHVGELFGDFTLSIDQAPWGRSSSNLFQERLASEFHCILRAKLQNWLHTVDSITVWKRSKTTTIVFADSDSEGSDDEEAEYRHIPPDERLPTDIAAPCVQHLLMVDTLNDHPIPDKKRLSPTKETNGMQEKPGQSKKKKRRKISQQSQTTIDANDKKKVSTEEPGYVCPW